MRNGVPLSQQPGPVADDDARTLALRALVWVLADDGRARRLLDLTGLDAEQLRAGAGTRAMGAAVIGFLANHEADLIACAAALDVSPARLRMAGDVLADDGVGDGGDR